MQVNRKQSIVFVYLLGRHKRKRWGRSHQVDLQEIRESRLKKNNLSARKVIAESTLVGNIHELVWVILGERLIRAMSKPRQLGQKCIPNG